MPVMPPSPVWVYRAGIHAIYAAGHEIRFSHTFVSETAPGSHADEQHVCQMFAQQLQQPFGTGIAHHFIPSSLFFDRIWPRPGFSEHSGSAVVGGSAYLVAGREEAALRVQRVGALGSGAGIGRIAIPVQSSTWFTDFPTCRHIDTATVLPLLTSGLFAADKVIVYHSRTYTNAIWHRETMTFTPLDHYRLLDNPIRIWGRWRSRPGTSIAPRMNLIPSELP